MLHETTSVLTVGLKARFQEAKDSESVRLDIRNGQVNPFTPKWEQFQVPPAASPEIFTQYEEVGFS